VGFSLRAASWQRAAIVMGACQHPHRHCSSIVRDRPHAQGATRAVMSPRATRTHRSRRDRAIARSRSQHR
jgi:hypothetical protein